MFSITLAAGKRIKLQRPPEWDAEVGGPKRAMDGVPSGCAA